MLKYKGSLRALTCGRLALFVIAFFCWQSCCSLSVSPLLAQENNQDPVHKTKDPSSKADLYARKNSYAAFVAYSPNSSHILMGDAENRKILNIGFAWSRRIFANRVVDWQYDAEVIPVALVGDPERTVRVDMVLPKKLTYYGRAEDDPHCSVTTESFDYIFLGEEEKYTTTTYCKGRDWKIGEGVSPVGFRWNFRPKHRLQPMFEGHGGYMYSSQPTPVRSSGSFNFTFDFGVGFERYLSRDRSVRLEYRFHHISNHDTADQNPGIDNGLFQLSYVFGKR